LTLGALLSLASKQAFTFIVTISSFPLGKSCSFGTQPAFIYLEISMKKQGFSLLEFLISFTLLIFVITATAQVIIHSLFAKRQAEINSKIAELAALKLEYFKSLPYESSELSPGQQSESLQDHTSQKIYTRSWKIQDISSNLKKVEMEVSSQIRTQKKTRLVLFISRELGF
jgi:Tfp pilus assembly protein PilV